MSTTQQAIAQIGGIPTKSLDIPICSVLIAIFAGLAGSHLYLQRHNQGLGHKFWFNQLCFSFAFSRIIACIFRIIWATQPTNVNVSLVAAIFLNAGILVAYIINLFLVWRMVKSSHPSFGWKRTVWIFNHITLWLILLLILPLITVIVLRVKRPDLPGIAMASNVIGKLAQTYFLLINIEAGILLLYSCSRRSKNKDNFGKGSWRAKVGILGTTIALATTEAGFRCGTVWSPAPLAINPAWWDSKAAFYCFNFMIDVFILAVFLIGRIDKRFHIPNKSFGPGSYSRGVIGEEKEDVESDEISR